MDDRDIKEFHRLATTVGLSPELAEHVLRVRAEAQADWERFSYRFSYRFPEAVRSALAKPTGNRRARRAAASRSRGSR